MATIAEIRQKYPQYEDLSDQQLADALYTKSYADMPRADFDAKIGLTATPPGGLTPGSKEYALWARDQALAGKKLPQVSDKPPEPEFTGPNQDIGSKLYTWGGSHIEGTPVIGPTLIDWAKKGRAAIQGMTEEEVAKEFADAKEANPTTAAIGNVTGATLPLLALGTVPGADKLLGVTGSLPSQIGFGMGSGGVISAADTAARGGNAEDVVTSGLVGTALGGVLPALGGIKNAFGNKTAATKAVTEAIKGAPAADELKGVASQMFKAVDEAGVAIEPKAFQDMVINLAEEASKRRISPKLDPKAYATFEELGGVLGEVMDGRTLSLGDLHNLRQIAQKAATSSEGRDAMFADKIVDAIDSFVTKPGATIGPDGPVAGETLLNAIDTWGRSRRVGLIEDAMERATNSASGLENGLRVEFRKLLNNKKLSKLFTAQEKAEIARVVHGTTATNVMRLLGKFGFGVGSGSPNALGGTIGAVIGGLPGIAVTTGARKLAEVATEKAAERAAKVVATPNIPVATPRALPPGAIPPALLPLEVTKKREPISISVRGGANSNP